VSFSDKFPTPYGVKFEGGSFIAEFPETARDAGIYNKMLDAWLACAKEKQDEIMYRITTQQELEKKINELILQRSSLHEHIENLKRLSQDYCVCGSTMDSHYSENHAPISEFENYLQRNEL
tara:strand:- start:2040 stop:2402 length:363 start_codon:yes stop_codon:yes gene_type:complete